MKKYQAIRAIFDHVMEHGNEYSKADAISSDCTRDGLVNRVYIKKLDVKSDVMGTHVDSVAVSCTKNDYSDATDSDLRIEFGVEVPNRTILWANELSDKMLNELLTVITA